MTTVGVLVLLPAAAVAATVLYFLRVRMERPPVGVYTLRDVVVMMTVVVVLPVLYLELPSGVVATVLGLMTLFAVQVTLAPLLSGRPALLVALGAVAVELVLHAQGTPLATAWNDLLLAILVVGVANLYVQSGIKLRDVATFGVLLAGYDLVATVLLPTMGEFLAKTIGLPFAPVFAGWGAEPVVLGLGDVLMLALWTLASVKAFGRAAGWLAAGTGLALTVALVLAIRTGLLTGLFPVLVAAGPLMAAQYLLWHRRLGRERTMGAYDGRRKPRTEGVPPSDLALR